MLDDQFKTTRQEAEKRLIGCLLEYREEVAPEVFARIKDPRCIKDSHCRSILTVMKELHENGEPLDQTWVRRKFQEKEGKVPPWLTTELISAMGDVKNHPSFIEPLSKIILEENGFEAFRERANRAQTFDDAVGCANLVHSLVDQMGSGGQEDFATVCDSLMAKQQAIRDGTLVWGHSWPLESLNQHLRLEPGKLYTIAASKKGGKSLFLLATLYHLLTQDPPLACMLFSLEVTREEVCRKIFSHSSAVNSRLILSDQLSRRDFEVVQGQLGNVRKLPLTINDLPDLTAEDIRNEARRWKFRDRVPDGQGAVAVDFAQLLRLVQRWGQNEASAIKDAIYAMKRMAKELNVPVIVLAQLNKAADGLEPHHRFLEGSGALAQAPDAVLLIDLFDMRSPEEEARPIDAMHNCDIIIALQRTGESGIKIPCSADLSTGTFVDLALPEAAWVDG